MKAMNKGTSAIRCNLNFYHSILYTICELGAEEEFLLDTQVRVP